MSLSADKFYEAIVHKKAAFLKEMKSTGMQARAMTFSEFKPILSKIKDYELALRSTVFIAGNFPRGEDRISAYRLALMFAERWLQSLEREEDEQIKERAKTGCIKIKSYLIISQTESALQDSGMQSLDHLVTQPTLLLTELLTLNPVFAAIQRRRQFNSSGNNPRDC